MIHTPAPRSSDPATILAWARKHSTEDPATGCHIWRGNLSRSGYPRAQFREEQSNVPAMVHAATRGERARSGWGTTSRLFRTCGNRACVNPAHLTETPPARPTLASLAAEVAALRARVEELEAGTPARA